MNNLIALAVKLSGFGWVWQKIDGYKTILGVAGQALIPLANALLSLASLLNGFAHVDSLSAALTWAQHLKADPSFTSLTSNWQTFSQALIGLGIAHKVDKAVNTMTNIPPNPPVDKP